MADDIILDYSDFDKCINILEEFLICFVKYKENTSYNANLIIELQRNTLEYIPVASVKHELILIFNNKNIPAGVTLYTEEVAIQVNNLIDRFVAN